MGQVLDGHHQVVIKTGSTVPRVKKILSQCSWLQGLKNVYMHQKVEFEVVAFKNNCTEVTTVLIKFLDLKQFTL